MENIRNNSAFNAISTTSSTNQPVVGSQLLFNSFVKADAMTRAQNPNLDCTAQVLLGMDGMELESTNYDSYRPLLPQVLAKAQQITCKMILSQLLSLESACSYDIEFGAWLKQTWVGEREEREVSPDELNCFDQALACKDLTHEKSKTIFEPILSAINTRFKTPQERDAFRLLVLQGFRVQHVSVQQIFGVTSMDWLMGLDWLISDLKDASQETSLKLLIAQWAKKKGLSVSQVMDELPWLEFMEGSEKLLDLTQAQWVKLASLNRNTLNYFHHHVSQLSQYLKVDAPKAMAALRTYDTMFGNRATLGWTAIAGGLDKSKRAAIVHVDNLKLSLSIAKSQELSPSMLKNLLNDISNFQKACRKLVNEATEAEELFLMLGNTKSSDKDSSFRIMLGENLLQLYYSLPGLVTEIKMKLHNAPKGDAIGFDGDYALDISPVEDFEDFATEDSESKTEHKIDDSKLNQNVITVSKKKRKRKKKKIEKAQLTGELENIQSIADQTQKLNNISATKNEQPSITILEAPPESTAAKTSEVFGSNNIISVNSHHINAANWGRQLFANSHSLIEKNRNAIEALPPKLRTYATHSLKEFSSQLAQGMQAIGLLREAIQDNDHDKVALTLRSIFLNMALTMEQHFAFAKLCRDHRYPGGHNLNKLRAGLNISDQLTQLSDRYHLALYWVRGLGSNSYSRAEKGEQFNKLAALWGYKGNTIDLSALVRDTVNDYTMLVQEVLGEESPVDISCLNDLKNEIDGLLENHNISRPDITFSDKKLENAFTRLQSLRHQAQDLKSFPLFHCLEDASYLLRVLDMGLTQANNDERPEMAFWHNSNIGIVDKIAEELYQAFCYAIKIGKLEAHHSLLIYQRVLDMKDTEDAHTLRQVNLGKRHHYTELKPTTLISKAYQNSLTSAKGSPDSSINGDASFGKKIRASIPALLNLVSHLEEAIHSAL
ncbi:MAG: hypothetical protein Q8K75_03745 [Chlamydiales bacterium]|nr:hypothetical protein [Chlamydiales bacterium]